MRSFPDISFSCLVCQPRLLEKKKNCDQRVAIGILFDKIPTHYTAMSIAVVILCNWPTMSYQNTVAISFIFYSYTIMGINMTDQD